ncbi:MAG: M42 family metallopeptidase [Chloroflexota bacterium]|nr:M42 family metallopeptidase [Chloroflexota bacterium]
MPLNEDLLRRLTQTSGIASREERVRAVVSSELEPLVDSLSVDVLGNLIGTKTGSGGPRVAVAAHMDEIGFLIRHIDDSGFLRLQKIGGFDPRVLVAQRVVVHTRAHGSLPGVLQPGSKPIHLQGAGDRKEIKLEDLFVDLGMSAAEVKGRVTVGDMVTMERDQIRIGDTVVSKALDDRLGIYVMIEAIKRVTGQAATVLAIATTQEEIGLRGATTSAFGAEADIAIALDVTIAADIPDNSSDAVVTRLGEGTAIKLFDSSQLPDPRLVQHLIDLAEANSIPFQREILPAGGTDAGAFQKSRVGVRTATISIPTRYVHTVNEMAHETDIQASVDLLAAFLNDAGARDYSTDIAGE